MYLQKWLIVLGAFLCYLLADGCTFSIGVFYSEFLSVFAGTKAQTAILPGLIYGIPMLSGPFVCPLVDTLGSPITAAMGGILLFSSFLASSFLSELLYLNLILGLFATVGLELVYVSAIVCVSVNFERHLGLATGLTVAGSGVGMFLFNPLLSNLIEKFTWRGAMMIESALLLHVLSAASLFHFVINEMKRKKGNYCADNRRHEEKIELVKLNQEMVIEKDELSFEAPSPVKRLYSSEMNLLDVTDSAPESIQPVIIRPSSPDQVRPLKYRPSHLMGQLRASNSLPFVNPGPGTHANYEENSSTPKLSRKGTDVSSNGGDQAPKTCPHKLPIDTLGGGFITRLSERGGWVADDSSTEQRYISRQETGSFRHRRVENDSPIHHRSCDLLDMRPSTKQTSIHKQDTMKKEIEDSEKNGTQNFHNSLIPGAPSVEVKTHKNSWSEFLSRLSESLKGLISRDIWNSWEFLLFSCMMIGVSGSMVVPLTFIYDRAIEANVQSFWASFLISLIGIFSTIGQIVFGFLADYISPLLLMVCSCLVMAVSLVIMSLPVSYNFLCVLCSIFGFSQSAAYSLYTLILISFLGADRLYAALAIYLPIIGVTNLITTPLAGFVYDRTGSYDLSFLLGGCIVFVSCILSIPLLIKEIRSKRIIVKNRV